MGRLSQLSSPKLRVENLVDQEKLKLLRLFASLLLLGTKGEIDNEHGITIPY
jgi:hypothetical protein